MEKTHITAGNRAAWNEAAPLHREQNQARLLEQFSHPGYSCLDAVASQKLQAIGVRDKDVAHLCCNNAQELLSVKSMGARRCVGFDGAQGFIDQAQELNAAAGYDCTFVHGDIYAVPDAFDAAFDVVLVTIGVMNWMPDLGGFFAVAARLLRPGGTLFIYEQHPIMDMVEPGQAQDPVTWARSYFREGAHVDTDGLDYFGGGTYAAKPLYETQHTMADVIMAGIGAGLLVADFVEYPHHISNTWYNVEHQGPQLPMCYSLVMTKAA